MAMSLRDPIGYPHPRGWVNPINLRASAALAAAGAWDAAPVEQNVAYAQSISFGFTYTPGAAGGGFDFQIEVSLVAQATALPAGAAEWITESVYAAGAVAAGADTQSRVQREYETYVVTGAVAEDFIYVLELPNHIERIRVRARESADGVQGTPGTLQIMAVAI